MTYFATFFTHYDAIKFSKTMKQHSVSVQLMPVPRKISSSCGTCAKFETDGDIIALANESMEQIVVFHDDGFSIIFDNR